MLYLVFCKKLKQDMAMAQSEKLITLISSYLFSSKFQWENVDCVELQDIEWSTIRQS